MEKLKKYIKGLAKSIKPYLNGVKMSKKLVIIGGQRLFRELLEVWIGNLGGYEVYESLGSGVRGVDLVMEARPDVVVVDEELPDMGVLELTRRLSEEAPKLRVLILTQDAAEYPVYRLKRSTVMGVIEKRSAGKEQLSLALEKILDWRLYYSERVEEVFRHIMQEPESFFKVLTLREQEMLRLFGLGWTNCAVAKRMRLSHSTIQGHRRNIMAKLSLKNTPDLICYAIMAGFVSRGSIQRERGNVRGDFEM